MFIIYVICMFPEPVGTRKNFAIIHLQGSNLIYSRVKISLFFNFFNSLHTNMGDWYYLNPSSHHQNMTQNMLQHKVEKYPKKEYKYFNELNTKNWPALLCSFFNIQDIICHILKGAGTWWGSIILNLCA